MTCNYQDISQASRDIINKTNKHPCFSFEAHHKYARMHLPVAPQCNISCNYCNRKFDCVNESRPGVTSEILTPKKALEKFKKVKGKIPNLSVVGIAGPGDALANWESTKESIRLIGQYDPDAIYCISTNGLMLPKYAQQIVELGVKHVTVTVNSLQRNISAKIYKYINYEGEIYTGAAGVDVLITNQLAGIKYLTSNGIMVKVNIVMIKGVNDQHIPEVVKKVKELGAFITNIMPLIPAQGSAFAHYPETNIKEVNKMRKLCEVDMKQMYHCKQCRADAIGLLSDDRSKEFKNDTGKLAVKKRDIV
ncbi:MAG: nitrogenase cofactor biosynthesis protein NifB [Firmicutes bacterium]|nr:nitrogenase cofactor biosynthesis protein NifB [Bacillota bacterium]